MELQSFEISERLVSYADYCSYLSTLPPEEAERRSPMGGWGPLQASSNAPVVGVSAEDAVSFARWRGGGVRLPTNAEWEKATRGESTQERLDERAHLTLSDLSAGLGELCLSQQGSIDPIIKGGRYSFGLVSARQAVAAHVKCADVSFRLVRLL